MRCIIPQAVNTVCAPKEGSNYRPKHVGLIGIINKPLLLHLVGCLCYCISDARSYKHQMHVSYFWLRIFQLEYTGWAKVGLQLWVRETLSLFLYYLIFA